ncbi:hypothetical protein LCGC14_3094080, partial [marine sediment metagenome]
MISSMAARDPEVGTTQAAPTLPQLMPLMAGPYAWYRRTFICSGSKHRPVWSREQNEPAKTKYCEFCGVVLDTKAELHADPPNTGGKVLMSYGWNLHDVDCPVRGRHVAWEGDKPYSIPCQGLLDRDWG